MGAGGLGLVWVALAVPLFAEDPLVDRGFDHFYNLEYDQAIADFQQAIANNPDSPSVHNDLAEALVFREMYRDGALESELVSGNNSFLRRPKLNPTPEIEHQFLTEVARAMALSEARLKQNPKDTAAMYALGISYGLRADYHWLVQKAWRDSLSDATAARKWHNRITEMEPANVDARLVQGLHDYIVGSLPVMYRMLGFLAGIKGDRERGIQTIEEVAHNGKQNKAAAQIFLCALYRRENQPMRAVPLVQDLIARYPRNFLLRLELSQMYSLGGDGGHALEVVEELARHKANGDPSVDRLAWEKIYFQEGTIQFWYRDLDGALENLKRVADSPNELDLNSGAQAYLRIGQIYDLKSRRPEALQAYKKCIAYAPEADAAHESRKYLSAPYRRL
jgi:tetratricopeptide (TPR) repeat protein